ncbi:probable opine utilization operon represso [Arthrobacter sp. Hiyo8]|nr:probable opine utilization operon represso [Arthrobacter sp. Hiyo8]
MTELLGSPGRPSALIMSYSRLALPAFQAIKALGLRVPDDVSLVCLDDTDWMTVSAPPVSAVHVPSYELGVRAAEILLARIAGAGLNQRITFFPPSSWNASQWDTSASLRRNLRVLTAADSRRSGRPLAP